MRVECYIYTNGRSTYKHCLKFLKASIEFAKSVKGRACELVVPPIYTFHDRKMVDAMNCTLDICDGTHILQVGDDFILHPFALAYMLKQIRKVENGGRKVAMYNCHLWEVWTNRIVSGIKIYSVAALRSIGGFVTDQYAKMDKPTHIKLVEAGFGLLKDRSIVGLHACGTQEEQQKYERLWSEAAGRDYKKSTYTEMRRYKIPIQEQVKIISSGFLGERNKKIHTQFSTWLEIKKKETRVGC